MLPLHVVALAVCTVTQLNCCCFVAVLYTQACCQSTITSHLNSNSLQSPFEALPVSSAEPMPQDFNLHRGIWYRLVHSLVFQRWQP